MGLAADALKLKSRLFVRGYPVSGMNAVVAWQRPETLSQ
jgi:hypothetical protein